MSRYCYKAVKALFQDKLCDYEREHLPVTMHRRTVRRSCLGKIAAEDKQVKVILNAANYGAVPVDLQRPSACYRDRRSGDALPDTRGSSGNACQLSKSGK